jgi:TPR repeat protein
MEPKKRRAAMKPTSDRARRWGESLRVELEQWPGVSVKRAFGMIMVYRGEVVFAALPGTRALFEEDAVLIKFAKETPALLKKIAAEACFAAGTMQQRGKKKQGEGRKWRIFLLREERDAREAVEWLARAYKLARN